MMHSTSPHYRQLQPEDRMTLAHLQLQAFVNQPIGDFATLNPSELVPALPIPNRIEDWTERAEAESHEIRSHNVQVKAARYAVEKLSPATTPRLTLLPK